MSKEEWRPVVGHEGSYEVSDRGNVRSLTRQVTYMDGRVGTFVGRTLQPHRGAKGYVGVSISERRHWVHRMVAEAFLPQPAGCNIVNHKNGDKHDNSVANLEWGTYAHNNRHARDTGLLNQHGENCNLTKYSDQLVAAVRRVHQRYSPTYREMALLFDMSEMQAADIVKGRTRARG